MSLRYMALVNGAEVEMVAEGNMPFTVEEFNGAFDLESAIVSGYNIGMKFPIEGNESVFNYANILSVANREFKVPLRVYNGTQLRRNGWLYIKKIPKNGVSGYFDCDFISSNFNVAIYNKMLQDALTTEISLGGSSDDKIIVMHEFNSYGWPKSPVAFLPTSVPKFYDEAEGMEEFTGVLNYYDRYGEVYGTNLQGEAKHSIAASVYVLEIIQEVFKAYGYRAYGPVMKDDRMKKVMVLSLHALDKIGQNGSMHMAMTIPMTVTGVTDLVSFDTTIADFTGQGFVFAGSPYPVEAGETYFNVIKIRTGATVTSSVLAIRRNVGGAALFTISAPQPNTTYQFAFTHTYAATTNEGLALSVSTGDSCDVEYLEWNVRKSQEALDLWNKWADTFKLGDCVPRIPISEFLRAVRKTYNVRFDVDDVAKEAYVSFNVTDLSSNDYIELTDYAKKHAINNEEKKKYTFSHGNEHYTIEGSEYLGAFDTEADLTTGLPSVYWPGAITYVRALNLYKKDNAGGDVGGKYQSDPIGDGTDEVNIDSGITLPKMIFDGLVDDPTQFFYPEYEDIGSSFWGGLGKNDFPLIFINNYGFSEHLPGTPAHIFSSPYNINENGDHLDGFSLAPLEESGTAWNDLWIPWLRRVIDPDEVEITIPLTVDLIKPGKYYYLDGVRYMAKSWKEPADKSSRWASVTLVRI